MYHHSIWGFPEDYQRGTEPQGCGPLVPQPYEVGQPGAH